VVLHIYKTSIHPAWLNQVQHLVKRRWHVLTSKWRSISLIV